MRVQKVMFQRSNGSCTHTNTTPYKGIDHLIWGFHSPAYFSNSAEGGHYVFKWILRVHLKPTPNATISFMFEVNSIKFW